MAPTCCQARSNGICGGNFDVALDLLKQHSGLFVGLICKHVAKKRIFFDRQLFRLCTWVVDCVHFIRKPRR